MFSMPPPTAPQPSQQYTTDTDTGASTLLGQLLDRINQLESSQLQTLQRSMNPKANAFLAGGVDSQGATHGAAQSAKSGAQQSEDAADDSTTDDDAAEADNKVGAIENLVLGTVSY